MNSKLAKKIRQAQRKQLPDIPKEVDMAIEKAFLMGVEVGRKKERDEINNTKCKEPAHG